MPDADYWEGRYAGGRNSGRGSAGKQAKAKAAYVQHQTADHGIRSVLDIGSGDGRQAALLDLPGYLGVDPSPTAVALARERCPNLEFGVLRRQAPRDLHLSLDVIYHLTADADFDAHMRLLFAARELVVVYSTDFDALGAEHVRHRRWTHLVPGGWEQIDHTVLRLGLPDLYTYRRVS